MPVSLVASVRKIVLRMPYTSSTMWQLSTTLNVHLVEFVSRSAQQRQSLVSFTFGDWFFGSHKVVYTNKEWHDIMQVALYHATLLELYKGQC